MAVVTALLVVALLVMALLVVALLVVALLFVALLVTALLVVALLFVALLVMALLVVALLVMALMAEWPLHQNQGGSTLDRLFQGRIYLLKTIEEIRNGYSVTRLGDLLAFDHIFKAVCNN